MTKIPSTTVEKITSDKSKINTKPIFYYIIYLNFLTSCSFKCIMNVFVKYFDYLFRNNFDDTEEAIVKRIEIYNEKTKPIAANFNAKSVFAERSAEEIFEDVQKIMNDL